MATECILKNAAYRYIVLCCATIQSIEGSNNCYLQSSKSVISISFSSLLCLSLSTKHLEKVTIVSTEQIRPLSYRDVPSLENISDGHLPECPHVD